MRMAHLIMAYKDPAQIERLVRALRHEGFDFYIHVDKKIAIKDFEYLAAIENVFFVTERIKVNWAGYSFTQSILNCVEEILQVKPYDFINLLSGQDYPIKPTPIIHDFFKNNIGKSFIAYDDPDSKWWQNAIHRIEKYHLTNFDFKGRFRIEWLMNLILPKRKLPLPYTLFGGECATWWTISTECAQYLVNFVKVHRRLQRFTFFTWAPDEFLIPTILMNSPYKNSIVNNNYRYIDWSLGGSNPKILTEKDFQALFKSKMLIARKFDIKVDQTILDSLDKKNSAQII